MIKKLLRGKILNILGKIIISLGKVKQGKRKWTYKFSQLCNPLICWPIIILRQPCSFKCLLFSTRKINLSIQKYKREAFHREAVLFNNIFKTFHISPFASIDRFDLVQSTDIRGQHCLHLPIFRHIRRLHLRW